MPVPSWLLLLYSLPAKHGAARVSLWRKLQKTGALPFKTSAYLLPDTPAHLELFQWFVQQIRDGGGEAILVRGEEIEGRTHAELVQLFHDARAEDYRALIKEMSAALAATRRKRPEDFAERVGRFRKALDEIARIDHFGNPLAQNARMTLQKLEQLGAGRAPLPPVLRKADFQGKTWLTRPRPQIDRVGCAWLIKNFIDPRAKFVFAPSLGAHRGAIPFDMLDVEFTHHGDDCTFETLLKRFALGDRTLARLGQMVHNADLGDGKFTAAEGEGIDRMLRGLARQGWPDEKILAHGFVSFAALYAQVKGG
jgi:hypothetical protein